MESKDKKQKNIRNRERQDTITRGENRKIDPSLRKERSKNLARKRLKRKQSPKINKWHFGLLATTLVLTLALGVSGLAIALKDDSSTSTPTPKMAQDTRKDVRFATFNVSFDRANKGQLATELSDKDNLPDQVKNIVEIIQINHPDVILLNEFNYDENDVAIKAFQDILKTKTFNGSTAIDYPYYYSAPSNTGVQPNPPLDINGDGVIGTEGTRQYGDDSFGYGEFPGKYGMALLSKYPIVNDKVRTFRKFLWKDMPNALLPDAVATSKPNDFYSDEVLNVFRLSSKSHWDVPIRINGQIVHALVSHPTPPTFDGAEDKNGKRNHDEIRFWADYIDYTKPSYIYDDTQADLPANIREKKNIDPNAMFVIMGDNNADPVDGDSADNAALQYLNSPFVNTTMTPERSGTINSDNQGTAGDSLHDTAGFAGGLRVDYVLPSSNLEMVDAVVFWPHPDDQPYGRLIARDRADEKSVSSDHRLVYVTVKV